MCDDLAYPWLHLSLFFFLCHLLQLQSITRYDDINFDTGMAAD